MKKYIIYGGNNLKGEIRISGSKNVVLKALIAACLTEEEVEISNVPLISDFYTMIELIKEIGGKVSIIDHKVKIRLKEIKNNQLSLENAAKIRTSSMFLSALLIRAGKAVIPNPGGCRIGARPIDRHIKGLEEMGAKIVYNPDDGFFYSTTHGLHGTDYTFEKNTHTGTETLILAAVMADGRTVLNNAACEPEIDDLINMLNLMGAKINRIEERKIIIDGVKKLNGVSFKIMPDRNELITFAIISALTGGNVVIKNGDLSAIKEFLEKFKEVGGEWENINSGIRFYLKSELKPVDVVTMPHPGFMTDWQGPWAILMTQVKGLSTIHETVYENRFTYVDELKKMGVKIDLFSPKVDNPIDFYNFNYTGEAKTYKHAAKIFGGTSLHNAVINIGDLRAGATLVIAALIAKGENVIFGVEHLERGYETFDKRLKSIGANIKVLEEKYDK